jgi:hypothetical protein
VGAWTDGGCNNITSGGANTAVDFSLFDSKGKLIGQVRQQHCATTLGVGGPKAITCPEVARVNWFYPQNGLFLACHAGWLGIRNINQYLPGPRVCIGFRYDYQNLDTPSLNPTYTDWLPVAGDLATVQATVAPSKLTKLFSNQDEFKQFLVVFVQSTTFPVFF